LLTAGAGGRIMSERPSSQSSLALTRGHCATTSSTGVRKAVAMAKDGAPDNEIEAAVAYVGNALGALVATIPTA
jgi:hypothetical protein